MNCEKSLMAIGGDGRTRVSATLISRSDASAARNNPDIRCGCATTRADELRAEITRRLTELSEAGVLDLEALPPPKRR